MEKKITEVGPNLTIEETDDYIKYITGDCIITHRKVQSSILTNRFIQDTTSALLYACADEMSIAEKVLICTAKDHDGGKFQIQMIVTYDPSDFINDADLGLPVYNVDEDNRLVL